MGWAATFGRGKGTGTGSKGFWADQFLRKVGVPILCCWSGFWAKGLRVSPWISFGRGDPRRTSKRTGLRVAHHKSSSPEAAPERGCQ